MHPGPDTQALRAHTGGMKPFTVQSLLRKLAIGAVANTLIAMGITLAGVEAFSDNFIYSQCIGLSIVFLIDTSRHLFIADWETQWRRLLLIVPVAVVVGYLAGSALGDLYFGKPVWQYLRTHPNKSLGFLLLSLVVGVSGTYYFMSREQLMAAREREETALRLAAEARLKLLETQLEPHMLFNTLANLRVLIGIDPARAQAMLDQLNDYLRATLAASRATRHTLALEFARLNDYLDLMAVRMGPRLRYRLELPEEVAAVEIPPLLLQPLVENSIRHGLEPKVDGGEVRVLARRVSSPDGDVVELEVTDTGVGQRADLPGASHSTVARRQGGSGFGTAQVRERLATAYGVAARMVSGANDDGGGHRTVLSLPMPRDVAPAPSRWCDRLRMCADGSATPTAATAATAGAGSAVPPAARA